MSSFALPCVRLTTTIHSISHTCHTYVQHISSRRSRLQSMHASIKDLSCSRWSYDDRFGCSSYTRELNWPYCVVFDSVPPHAATFSFSWIWSGQEFWFLVVWGECGDYRYIVKIDYNVFFITCAPQVSTLTGKILLLHPRFIALNSSVPKETTLVAVLVPKGMSMLRWPQPLTWKNKIVEHSPRFIIHVSTGSLSDANIYFSPWSTGQTMDYASRPSWGPFCTNSHIESLVNYIFAINRCSLQGRYLWLVLNYHSICDHFRLDLFRSTGMERASELSRYNICIRFSQLVILVFIGVLCAPFPSPMASINPTNNSSLGRWRTPKEISLGSRTLERGYSTDHHFNCAGGGGG